MEHPYADFVASVEKPARYLGGEYQSVRKDFAAGRARVRIAQLAPQRVGQFALHHRVARFAACRRAACCAALSPACS